MAKPRTPPPPRRVITPDRAARLFRLLSLLGQRPQPRSELLRRLGLDVRSFYRDLQLVRELGISLELVEHRYVLTEPLDDALARLPFPDPHLNLHEAMLLAQGNSPAHRRLQQRIEQFIGKPLRRRPRASSR